MILKHEILKIATDNQLSPQVIEKDYVLGWLLAGINQHLDLGSHWVFKGGTCLKKCYFETYRFSEDLDFTVIDSKHLNQSLLQEIFKDISKWIYQVSGIEIPDKKTVFELYKNPRGNISCQGRIYYRGPLAPTSQQRLPRIKLDITSDETLVESTILNLVSHPYSDRPSQGIQTLCYSYNEIFAEKIRALLERERARDLYDVLHLFRRPESRELAAVIKAVLAKKCQFKNISLPTYDKVINKKEIFSMGWKDQLSHQLPALPSFESFWSEVPKFFGWLYEKDIAVPIQKIINYPLATREDIASQTQTSKKIKILEKIRFSAINYLCAKIHYSEGGEQKIFIIEPYSLVKNADKNLLIYSLINQTKEIKAFNIDFLQAAEITSYYFTPSYQIEFLPEKIRK